MVKSYTMPSSIETLLILFWKIIYDFKMFLVNHLQVNILTTADRSPNICIKSDIKQQIIKTTLTVCLFLPKMEWINSYENLSLKDLTSLIHQLKYCGFATLWKMLQCFIFFFPYSSIFFFKSSYDETEYLSLETSVQISKGLEFT